MIDYSLIPEVIVKAAPPGPQPFEIIDVPTDIDPEIESLGSKEKFWVTLDGRRRCLFKAPRPGTGEDWSEKVAAELAALLGLPHAHVDFARFGERRGILSETVVLDGEALVHGNEILSERVPGYPLSTSEEKHFYRLKQHTIFNVLQVNSDSQLSLPMRWLPVEGISTPVEVFLGYLLFDAWIGNTDRHHQNWGWVRRAEKRESSMEQRLHLCASYDHGSSLGALITDRERDARLRTRDMQRTVKAFAARARSAFYGDDESARTLHPCEALRMAAERYPRASKIWHHRLVTIRHDIIPSILERVPEEIMSSTSREFVATLLSVNRDEITRKLEGML